MDRNEAPATRRKPPANRDSPILPPPRHVSTLPIRYPSLSNRPIQCTFRTAVIEGQEVEAIMDYVEGYRTKLTGMTEGT